MESITKQDLFQMTAEMLERIDRNKAEILERIDRNKAEVFEHIDQSKAELRAEIAERTEHVETTLLKEFRKWAVPHNARLKVFEISVHGLTERVELIEERLTDLEQR